jgi:methylmalonyl-CoA mutase C-terminal domain/subunit
LSDSRPIRVLLAKVGLDGHDRGIRVVARALQEAGFEVIYGGLRHTPETVVEAALQEDVDAIGISMLSAAHMAIFPRVLELMGEAGLDDVVLTGGGIIPPADAAELSAMGVGKLFGPGTPLEDLGRYLKEEVPKRRRES